MLNKKRIGIMLIIFFSIFMILNFKFICLQFLYNKKYFKEVAAQRSTSVKITDNRGVIYDRNMIPLVNTNQVRYAVVFPEFIKGKKEIKALLEDATGEKDISEELSSKKPFALKVKNNDENLLKELKENDIFIVDGFERYGAKNIARNIIGYTGTKDGHGKAGIEKACDKFLFSTEGRYLGIISDALHRSIGGLGVRLKDGREFKGELDVKLTLDYHIQKIVETCMDRNKISGAVVILEPDNGDIIAIASRPHFRQDTVKSYINSKGSELVNRALSSYNTGSVFKIVVAAAALESGKVLPTDTFYCNGNKMVQERSFKCSKAHGLVDFSEGFASSCNSAFIDIGLKTGKNEILTMAKKFGYGMYTNLAGIGLYESKGNLPDSKYASEKEIANLAIGQGDILATPLQVAGMVAAVANDGIKTDVNLVDSVINKDGRIVKKVRYINRKRIISSYTASKLKLMMQEAASAGGTGEKASLSEFGGSAGKTGTAQTGWINDGEAKVHAWFAGYFPIIKPQYALVVFVEDGQSGSEVAAPIFKEIASKIMELGKR